MPSPGKTPQHGADPHLDQSGPEVDLQNCFHVLARFALALEAAQSVEEVMDVSMAQLRESVGYSRLAAYEVSPDRSRLTMMAASGELEPPELLTFREFDISGDPFLTDCLRTSGITVVPDARLDPRTDKAIVEAMQLCTIVNIPIVARDRHLALFNTSTSFAEGPRVPTEFESGFLVFMARLVAAALDRVHQTSRRMDAETQIDELDRQLLHTQKMQAIGQLAGGIAHDFNNILTGVVGNVELAAEFLRDAQPDLHACSEHLDLVLAHALRASALTQDLLVFSRRDTVRPTRMDLRAVVTDTCRLLVRTLPESVTLTVDAGTDPIWVDCDASQAGQVVMNLILNARDALAGKQGRIEVGLGIRRESPGAEADPARRVAPGARAVLTVRDDGCGIEPAVRERVFEPFFTTKPSGRGTGLGLSTVWSIVDRWSGSVCVDSCLDSGSVFTVDLPLAPAPAGAADPVAAGTPLATGRGRIVLVAEDDLGVRQVIERVLVAAGYRVVAAADAAQAEALAKALPCPVDLLLTDVVMPGASGPQLARRLRAERPGLPVLFASGYVGELADGVDFAAEGSRLLQKPFTAAELLAAVRDVLAAGTPNGAG